MRLAYSEETLAKDRVRIKIALIDVNPFMTPFTLKVEEDKKNVTYKIVQSQKPLLIGGTVPSSYFIYDGVLSKESIPILKKKLQAELKTKLTTLRLDSGLSEGRFKKNEQ